MSLPLKFLLALFCVFANAVMCRADLGLPAIHAVCKVTLVNGSTVEGIIPFGPGGYEYDYRPNGFCVENRTGSYSLLLWDIRRPHYDLSQLKRNSGDLSQLFFIENTTGYSSLKQSVYYDDKANVLTKASSEQNTYSLHQTLTLFTSVPIELNCVRDPAIDHCIEIDVDDIKWIDLVAQPSSRWINYLESERKTFYTKVAEDEKNGKDWSEYYEPVWYHEILLDPEKMERILSGF